MVLGQWTLWHVFLAPLGSMVHHAMGGNLCLLFGLTHFRQKLVKWYLSGRSWSVQCWADAGARRMSCPTYLGGDWVHEMMYAGCGPYRGEPWGRMVTQELEQPSRVKASCSTARPLKEDNYCSNGPLNPLNLIIPVMQAHGQGSTF